ncbi:hypothetical protein AALO_G00286600 [Alosa alosa]|uniref:Kazal-like domain-containing protein n=1 Tax=Alosa alosa TaxID=278164 RepID=A0AAV6FFQ4_9TELE|nr:hypothetical protein AALO_G00286600 [Alosa alosa]
MKLSITITITLCTLLYFSGPGFTRKVRQKDRVRQRPPFWFDCSCENATVINGNFSNMSFFGRLKRAILPRSTESTRINPKTVCEAYFAGLLECDYQPLCATDDNTYDNVCALCEKIKSNSPEIRHDGKC